MEDDHHGRNPQSKTTSIAENKRKQVEIARNEQKLLLNSFRSTIVELEQFGKF
jgi:hypothetical protein